MSKQKILFEHSCGAQFFLSPLGWFSHPLRPWRWTKMAEEKLFYCENFSRIFLEKKWLMLLEANIVRSDRKSSKINSIAWKIYSNSVNESFRWIFGILFIFRYQRQTHFFMPKGSLKFIEGFRFGNSKVEQLLISFCVFFWEWIFERKGVIWKLSRL